MTRYQRASQIWSLLVCAAKDRKTYTYGDIADILGFGGAGVMAQILGCIMWFCEENNLPPLTVLVVNQETGLPGEGLTTLEEVNKDREAVFNFNWFGEEPPQNDDFENVDRNRTER
jgi:alkylated DNA nucleotide flippase Atl1